MSRVAVAILVVLALAHTSSVCDAGVLGFLGQKTERLRNDTREIVVEAEKRIKGFFGRGDEEPEETEPEATSPGTSAETGDEASTTVDSREIIAGAPRCAGDEEWDSDSQSCLPNLG